MQTTLARFLVGGTAALDLVLVVVVYVALTTGPVSGMLAGSVAGIIQDALSSGVIGIGGLAKSMVGFLAGAIGQQFIVTAALPRFVMFLGATALHAAVFMGLYVLLGAAGVSVAVGGGRQPGARQRRGRHDGVHDHRVAARGRWSARAGETSALGTKAVRR